MTTFIISPLLLNYWQICLPPGIYAAFKIMYMRKPVATQNRPCLTRGINPAPMYQYDRLALEFFQFVHALLKLVGGNMFRIGHMTRTVFTALADIQHQCVLVIDELDCHQRIHFGVGAAR